MAKLQLVSKVPDNANPSFTTFTIAVLQGGNAATKLVRAVRYILQHTNYLADSRVTGNRVTLTLTNVDQSRRLLETTIPELAELLT